MTEKKLNAVLYISLAFVVILYFNFNIFKAGPLVPVSADEVGTAVTNYKEEESSIELPEKTTAEMRTINPTGYHIYVNLDMTQMYVYKDGELFKTYEVSGGKTSSPSPTGTWRIIHKDTWGEGFGGAWLGFNVPWGTLHQEHMYNSLIEGVPEFVEYPYAAVLVNLNLVNQLLQ